ncbi:MAG: hypothetical protein IKC32_07645 [Clostridia bacterium]|nr:hypothetical protein [Clostridia bacterium]
MSFELGGSCFAEYNTEVRFDIAVARAQGAELVRLEIPASEDEKNNTRLANCLIKLLQSMGKSGALEFYLRASELDSLEAEAQFLLNKYPLHVDQYVGRANIFFVKI